MVRTMNASSGTEATEQHTRPPGVTGRESYSSVLLTAFSALGLKKLLNDTINI